MRIVRPSLGLPALAVLLATLASAQAATFAVDATHDAPDATPGDGACATAAGTCTLRAAVMEANALAGVDVVTLPFGTFRLTPTGGGEDLGVTGDLDVLDMLHVAGAGADDTEIDGFGADRIFDVHGANDLTVSDLTIKRGSAGGEEGGAIRHAGPGALTITNVRFERNLATGGAAVRHTGGPLTVSGSVFNANVAGYDGGAIRKDGTGAVAITGTVFSANTSSGPGGAVLIDGPENVGIADSQFLANGAGSSGGAVAVAGAPGFAVSNSVFEDSQAQGNGGAVAYAGPGTVQISGTRFAGGLAGGSGGGLYVDADGNLDLSAVTFELNAARYGGGGLYFASDAEAGAALAMQDATFDGNGAFGGQGGAFYVNAGGALTLGNVVVRNNFAEDGGGGGLAYDAASATIVGARVTGNTTASGSGGGLYVYAPGTATVADSSFTGNRTDDGDGGGLYLTGDGPFEIHRTTFASNVAGGEDGQAGGLFLASGEQALVLNCTFSGNGAGDQGGGLYAASDVKLWSSTFSGNAAVNEGGGIFNAYTVRIANTIVAASGSGGNCAGNEFDSGNRNIDSDGTCELDGPSDQEGVDPQLGPLAENGGPNATHALAPTSPAVDAGNGSICPPVDQRGLARPADGNGDGQAVCDIGAYEYFDQCPGDPQKTDPGPCGCGNVETDTNDNGVIDCLVNAELKARIARARTVVDALDGQRSPEEQARRAELRGVASGLASYLADHAGGIVLADPSANPKKLVKKVRKAVKALLRARGGKLDAARERAEAALDALDRAIAAQ